MSCDKKIKISKNNYSNDLTFSNIFKNKLVCKIGINLNKFLTIDRAIFYSFTEPFLIKSLEIVIQSINNVVGIHATLKIIGN